MIVVEYESGSNTDDSQNTRKNRMREIEIQGITEFA